MLLNQLVRCVRVSVKSRVTYTALTGCQSWYSTMDSTQPPTGVRQPAERVAFVEKVVQLLRQEVMTKSTDAAEKVINFKHPVDLQEHLKLELGDSCDQEELLEVCKKAIDYSVKTAHPYFLNQLYNGLDLYSMAASWVVEALNTNQHTYEAAPVFTLVEKYMIDKLNTYTGFSDGDGIFAPGGTLANMVAVHLARFTLDESIKFKGLYNQRKLIMFASDECHYSIQTSANFMGFGLDSVVKVKTDEIGRMCPSDLEAQVRQCRERGEVPFVVQATCGSTVLGAFDPLDDLADVCSKHSIWLHVDAAWGGSVLASNKYKHLMKGIERCDSVLWNAHKMVGAQLQCSALLVRNKGILSRVNQLNASYLYQPDKFYDTSFDMGDKSVQCGRKADAFKLWFMWKAHGDDGIEAIIDKGFDNAQYLTEKLKDAEGFKLVLPEFQCQNVSFWYIPKRLRNLPETDEWWQEIGTIAPKMKEKMVMKGSMMIGYQPVPFKNWVNFFRVITRNPQLEHSDMDYMITHLDEIGRDL